MDTDDEVRDRATYYYSILEAQDKALSNHYIVEGLLVSRKNYFCTYTGECLPLLTFTALQSVANRALSTARQI
jgi:hypothetical protein